MKSKLVAVLLVVLMLAVTVAGCGAGDNEPANAGKETGSEAASGDESKGDDGESTGDKVIRWGTDSSPSGIFLPQYHNDVYNAYVTNNVFESLTYVDPEGNIEPQLAKSWDISDDGKTYTFHLQEGVKWHDGEPFTANDVAFTYNFMAQEKYGGYYATYISEIAGYDEVHSGAAETMSGINVIDENTIEITTTNVYSSLLNRIGGSNVGIIAEHIWKDVDVETADQQTELIQNPVGTGAFKMLEYVPDQYVSLEANKDYWGGAPKIDELIYVTVNGETAQAQMINGEIDVFLLSSVNEDDIQLYEESGLNVEFILDNGYQAMQINMQNPELGNVTIRQAIAYALNRQGMVDALLYGHGNQANTVYAESYWAHPGNENLSCFDYNPEKAIELFESQGYTYDADANKMYNPDGEQVSWRLFVPNNNPVRQASGTIIQDNLNAIGIDIDLQVMEFATVIATLQELEDADRFDFALTGYTMGADPDISMLVTTTGGNNYSCYSNEEIDAQVAEALQTADEETRNELYKELAVEISEELPLIYLYNQESAYAINPNVHVTLNPYQRVYHPYEWTVD